MGTALLMCVCYVGLSLFIFKAGVSLLGLCVFTRITLAIIAYRKNISMGLGELSPLTVSKQDTQYLKQ